MLPILVVPGLDGRDQHSSSSSVKGIVPCYKDQLLTNDLIQEALLPHAPTYIITTHNYVFYTILIPRRRMCRARVDRCKRSVKSWSSSSTLIAHLIHCSNRKSIVSPMLGSLRSHCRRWSRSLIVVALGPVPTKILTHCPCDAEPSRSAKDGRGSPVDVAMAIAKIFASMCSIPAYSCSLYATRSARRHPVPKLIKIFQ